MYLRPFKGVVPPGPPIIGFRDNIWECVDNGTLYQDTHRVDELTDLPPITRDPRYVLNGYTLELINEYVHYVENRMIAEIRAAHAVALYDDETQTNIEMERDEELTPERNKVRDDEQLRIRCALNRLLADLVLLWLESMIAGPQNDCGERMDYDGLLMIYFDTIRFSLIKTQNFLQDMMTGSRDDIADAPGYRESSLRNHFDETWEGY